MRGTISTALLFVCTIIMVQQANAQAELPRKSPKAGVQFTLGLTDIDIRYSSPSVNDRNIWGNVVPYGEVWRAGANEATTIEFSTDVIVEGEDLDAGRYAFFLIPRPGEEKWTAIFNREADQWGAFNYDPDNDALRIDIKPQYQTVNQERLTYSIHDQGMTKGYVKMAWGKVRVYLRLKVFVEDLAIENIEKALDNASQDDQWLIYAQGANFLLENDLDPRQAMQWADKSTRLRDHSWNWYVKAQLQAKAGDYTGALGSIQKSAEAGRTNPDDTFFTSSKDEIDKNVTEWRRKSGS